MLVFFIEVSSNSNINNLVWTNNNNLDSYLLCHLPGIFSFCGFISIFSPSPNKYILSFDLERNCHILSYFSFSFFTFSYSLFQLKNSMQELINIFCFMITYFRIMYQCNIPDSSLLICALTHAQHQEKRETTQSK